MLHIFLTIDLAYYLRILFKIQESEKGHWHIPIAEELDSRKERPWLCVTRASSHVALQDSSISQEGDLTLFNLFSSA